MKRGHSNIRGEIAPWPEPAAPRIARVPLVGGANVRSSRELPPLALTREEWEKIGQAMGWLSSAQDQKVNDLSAAIRGLAGFIEANDLLGTDCRTSVYRQGRVQIDAALNKVGR